MATRTINPQSNPYASGAVVFDSTPYVDFFVKQQVQEKAKDEALEKYLMDFDKTINPAGMRNNDVAPFLEKIGQNKNFYLKNKEAIKNPALDNGAAYSQWYNANKEALAEINKSKMLAEKDARFSKAILDAKKQGKTITDDFQKRYEMFRSLPMNDPRFVDINEEEVSFNNKPFNPSEFVKEVFYGIEPSKRTIASKKDPQTKRVINTVEYYIPEKLLPSIRNTAAYKYETDGSFKEKVDEAIFDENKMKELNDIYSASFKEPIKDRKDLATAVALSLSRIGKTVEEDEVDWMSRNQIKITQSGGGDGEGKKKNQTTDFVLRMKDAVEKGTSKDIANIGMELLAGGGGGTNKEFVQIRVADDKTGFKILYKDRFQGYTMKEIKEQTFNLKNEESYLRLARLFQDITGSNAKLEERIFTGKGGYLNDNPPQNTSTSGNSGETLAEKMKKAAKKNKPQ